MRFVAAHVETPFKKLKCLIFSAFLELHSKYWVSHVCYSSNDIILVNNLLFISYAHTSAQYQPIQNTKSYKQNKIVAKLVAGYVH